MEIQLPPQFIGRKVECIDEDEITMVTGNVLFRLCIDNVEKYSGTLKDLIEDVGADYEINLSDYGITTNTFSQILPAFEGKTIIKFNQDIGTDDWLNIINAVNYLDLNTKKNFPDLFNYYRKKLRPKLKNTRESFENKWIKDIKNQYKKYFKNIIMQVSCGDHHTAFVTLSGNIYTFGKGEDGRLGHGNEKDQLIPKKITRLK